VITARRAHPAAQDFDERKAETHQEANDWIYPEARAIAWLLALPCLESRGNGLQLPRAVSTVGEPEAGCVKGCGRILRSMGGTEPGSGSRRAGSAG